MPLLLLFTCQQVSRNKIIMNAMKKISDVEKRPQLIIFGIDELKKFWLL